MSDLIQYHPWIVVHMISLCPTKSYEDTCTQLVYRATGGDYIHRKETEMMLYVRKQEMVVRRFGPLI